MRYFLTTILSIIYLVVSSGFAINLHYCMNKLHSWELGVSEKDQCGKCGMKSQKKNSCCRDEVKLVKLQQDTLTAKATVFNFGFSALAAATSFYVLLPFKSFESFTAHPIHGPPLIHKQDTYLRNCVFRI